MGGFGGGGLFLIFSMHYASVFQGNKEQLSDKHRARPSFKGAVLLFHFTRRIKPPHL